MGIKAFGSIEISHAFGNEKSTSEGHLMKDLVSILNFSPRHSTDRRY